MYSHVQLNNHIMPISDIITNPGPLSGVQAYSVALLENNVNPFSPEVLDPGNYPKGQIILAFCGFFMTLCINVYPHVEQGGLKIEKITFSKRLIVISMVYHIGFKKILKDIFFQLETRFCKWVQGMDWLDALKKFINTLEHICN